MTRRKDSDLLPGAIYRSTHKNSVDSILLPLGKNVPVYSAGTQFYNYDNWTSRQLAKEFCDWCKVDPATKAPKGPISLAEVEHLIRSKPWKGKRYIQIAETPFRLSYLMAMALVGAAYHEAFHTVYTHTAPLDPQFMHGILAPRQSQLDWGTKSGQLLYWMNLIEDIRIERHGCTRYPGVRARLEDLQDFMLDFEEDKFLKSKEGKASAYTVVLGTFREIGKGYDTPRRAEALAYYESISPEAFQLVTTGALKPILDQTMAMGADDSLGCMTLAMDALVVLQSVADDTEESDFMRGLASEMLGDDQPDIQGIEKVLTEVFEALAKAMEDAIQSKKQPYKEEPEIAYRPFTTTYDTIEWARTTGPHPVTKYLSEVRPETAFLRTRMRQLFQANEFVDTEHGVKFGRQISNRMLVESILTARAGQRPDRAFIEVTEAAEFSAAACIVVDQSSSMESSQEITSKILLTLAEANDAIGTKTQVVGFSSNSNSGGATELYQSQENHSGTYHRSFPMTYTMYKDFDERFGAIKLRFSSLNARGSTPMADGINFGMWSLSPRNEGHRFIYVITDGCPDSVGVVKNRLREAARVGVKVIGVGIGEEAKYVTTLFPDSVWAEEISMLPALLVHKLTQLTDKHERNRYKRLTDHDLKPPRK